MSNNVIDTSLNCISYAQRANFLVDIWDTRSPWEAAFVVNRHIQNEIGLFFIRKIVLPNLRYK